MQNIDGRHYWHMREPAYFSALSTFGAMPETVIRRLLEKGRVLKLQKGERLYDAGERSDSFYVVLEGDVNTYMPGEEGGWTLARLHKPGDDMGFVPMIALTDRPGKTVAETDAVVLEITSGQFFDLHQQEPDAFGLMILNLVRGMARAVINMANMLEEQDRELQRAYSTRTQNNRDRD